uniref:Uncharacterized protein n=1 Tax=Physcomitrium patens TaxID=3218 RepID=A0A2K1KLW3_PHYPA|nr:hypothetical protein PHYPA_005657 [Physcomitrium patens]
MLESFFHKVAYHIKLDNRLPTYTKLRRVLLMKIAVTEVEHDIKDTHSAMGDVPKPSSRLVE